jgi:hypothetical protein
VKSDDFYQVALSGDGLALVVGARREDSNGHEADDSLQNSGAAYVFRRRSLDAPWAQQAYLKASNPGAVDSFGERVAMSGDGNVVAVAATGEDGGGSGVNGPDQLDDSKVESGAVYVFRSHPTQGWAQEAYVKASNPGRSDYFGYALALNRDGSTLAVGARLEASSFRGINGNAQQQADDQRPGSGAAYVFRRSGGSWHQEAYVKAPNADEQDQFGSALALSANGNLLAVGAPKEDSSATGLNGNQSSNGAEDSGAVYVYRRAGASWSHAAYVKASNTDVDDWFGNAVALSGDGSTLAVGSDESSAARGVNGDQSSNASPNSGAVYVFSAVGNGWQQQAYVKAAHADAYDHFGTDELALDATGTHLVVAAIYEDSSETDAVNGDQSLNDAETTGAAYVFVRTGTSWSQQAYLKPDVSSRRRLLPDAPVSFGLSVDINDSGTIVAAGAERVGLTRGGIYTFTDP